MCNDWQADWAEAADSNAAEANDYDQGDTGPKLFRVKIGEVEKGLSLPATDFQRDDGLHREDYRVFHIRSGSAGGEVDFEKFVMRLSCGQLKNLRTKGVPKPLGLGRNLLSPSSCIQPPALYPNTQSNPF